LERYAVDYEKRVRSRKICGGKKDAPTAVRLPGGAHGAAKRPHNEMRSMKLGASVEDSKTLSICICWFTITIKQTIEHVENFCILLKG
jgi:hypothetical protein